MRKVTTVKAGQPLQWTQVGLKQMKAYQFVVKAYTTKDGKRKYVKTSPLIHVYTSGVTKNHTNARNVKVKKAIVTIKKGKTFKIKAKVRKLKRGKKLMSTQHAPKLRYLSSNRKIATVSKSGKIKAKAKGTCYIYVYAHNGVSKRIKVTVK